MYTSIDYPNNIMEDDVIVDKDIQFNDSESNDSESNESDHFELNKLFYNDSILSGKIHESLEDPLSQLFYDISDQISPSLHCIGITPNFVTTIRTILMLVGFPYAFLTKHYHIAAIIYITSYFCDCLDGHLSRKYNLDTPFGDYYDHISDILGMIITLYLIGITLHADKKIVIYVVIFFFLISLIQISCQERYLRIMGINKDSKLLNTTICLCSESIVDDEDIESTMDITKLFGIGTFQLFITILLWNFEHLD
jgi:phosphatidylglycerophosphate synthase